MYNQVEKRTALVLSGLALTLTVQLLAGCGKSADEIAAQEKARSERAIAAAQAELEADQEKFRKMASGELRAPAAQTPVPADVPASWESAVAPQAAVSPSKVTASSEPKPSDASTPQPTDTKELTAPIVAGAAPAAAPRSAENVFAEVAASVARIHVMDVSGRVIGMGSGVVIDKAVVLTNCHVAMHGAKVAIRINNAVMPATIQLADEALDLCRLNVPGLDAAAVAIGSVASLRTGQRVYAIGAPAGLELTISEGIVSSLRKVDEGTVIQTTAPISPGSSGGGLFDMSGRLVGIMTFQHRYGQNLNFALPADWIGQMRARRASDVVARALLPGERSQDNSPATLILGQWFCRDWISGRAGQYSFEPNGSLSIALTDSRAATLSYRVSGKTLQFSDAKQGVTVVIEELNDRKMVLHGRDQSIACERS
jgi:serine protease Do